MGGTFLLSQVSIMPPPICLGHLRRTQARPARLRSGLMPKQQRSVSRFNMFCMVAIKETIDPNYMLDCQSCIGTATLAKAELGPADGGSEAGETKPTDSGEASDCSYYSTLLCLQTSLCFCMVSIFFLLL